MTSQTKIIVVDAGTVIEDPETGEKQTVTDNHLVMNSERLYCTKFAADALADAVKEVNGLVYRDYIASSVSET